MACTKYQIFLITLFVATGSINTLNMKWADVTNAKGADGKVKKFNHPFFQANCMFLGECLCFIVYKILFTVYRSKADGREDVKTLTKGNRTFKPYILFIPAMCDMIGSSLMFVGLNLTYASSYQMFRGAVIVFVGLLSMVFLKRMLKIIQWIGILFVIVGLGVVGLADYVSVNTTKTHEKMDIIIGDVIIVIAQIITATQMVVEEKFVAGLDIAPLHAVGWEGIFGFVVMGILLIPFYFIRAAPPVTMSAGDRLEDAIDAFVQCANSWELAVAITGTILSIAFYNFAGISVTKELSATTRKVLDSIRTIIIWIISLAFLGQKFHYLQLIGFILLIIGMFLYNGITFGLTWEKIKNCGKKKSKEPEEGNTADQNPETKETK